MSKEKKLKRLDIVFENCEVASLEPDMFKYLVIDKISKEYHINCYQYENGEIYECINCEYVSFIINEKGLNTKCGFIPEYEEVLKKRIDDSITHLDLIFDDDTNEYISVPWGGDSDYQNSYCHIKKNKKEIEIVIKKSEDTK